MNAAALDAPAPSAHPAAQPSGDGMAAMVDLCFALEGGHLPHPHRRALAQALGAALPWLVDQPEAGVHRLKVSPGEAGRTLLSRRSRLVLRLPRERAAAAQALCGTELRLAGTRLRVGAARPRELLPWGALYAPLVYANVAIDDGDAAAELQFLRWAQAQLQAQQVAARAICGRAQVEPEEALQGFSLMLDGLSGADSLRLQQRGLGPHRLLGCGLFVPHRSAAAVGSAR